jgi:hypothetical protein
MSFYLIKHDLMFISNFLVPFFSPLLCFLETFGEKVMVYSRGAFDSFIQSKTIVLYAVHVGVALVPDLLSHWGFMILCRQPFVADFDGRGGSNECDDSLESHV